ERALDQERRRRRLGDERERPVFEDRDLDRDDEAFLGLRPVVVLLAEVHDVERVGAQRRTDGRRRCRLPGGKSETDLPDDSFSHVILSTRSGRAGAILPPCERRGRRGRRAAAARRSAGRNALLYHSTGRIDNRHRRPPPAALSPGGARGQAGVHGVGDGAGLGIGVGDGAGVAGGSYVVRPRMKLVDGFGLMTRVGAGAPLVVLSNTAIVDGDAPSIALSPT